MKTILQAIKKFLSSRWMILVIPLLAFVLAAPTLSLQWFTDDYAHRLGHSRSGGSDDLMLDKDKMSGPMNAYSFFTGDRERTQRLMDKGVFPWWMNPNIKISFWRPVSALFLALDYTLWPDSAFAMHLQSVLWFMLLGACVTLLFRRLFGPVWLSGMAALVFIINDVHAYSTTWLANRHTLICLVFSVLCIYFFIKACRDHSIRYHALSMVMLALSLLSSEVGIAVFAFLFAWIVFMDRDKVKDKILKLLPSVLLIAAWRIAYSALGYSVKGAETYYDPIYAPVQFLWAMIRRLPIMANDVVSFPPADMALLMSEQAITITAIVSFLLLAIGLIVQSPLWRKDKFALFFLAGMLLSLIPLTSGMPGNRNAAIAYIGGCGFSLLVFYHLINKDFKKPSNPIWRVSAWATLVPVIVVQLFLAPYLLFNNANSQKSIVETTERPILFLPGTDLSRKDVILIGPPGNFVIGWQLQARYYHGLSIPDHLRILTADDEPAEITRIDDRTLLVEPAGGYCKPPGPFEGDAHPELRTFNPNLIFYRMERLVYSPGWFRKGQAIKLAGVTVTILELTPDGRPLKASFRFDDVLEDDRYVFLLWNQKRRDYDPFRPPKTGETALINQTIASPW